MTWRFNKSFALRLAILIALTLAVLVSYSMLAPVLRLPNLLRQTRTIVSNTLPLQEKWKYKIDGLVVPPLASQGNQIYISHGSPLSILNVETGKEVWTLQRDNELGVLMEVGEDAVVLYKADNLHPEVHVLDANTGQLKWKQPVTLTDTFAIGEGRLYVGTYHVSAYDLKDGKLVWSMEQELPSHTGIHVHYDAGKVYVMVGLRAYVLDAQDGRTLNSFDYAGSALELVTEETIFGMSMSDASATDAKTGALLWKKSLLPYTDYVWPAVIHGVLYLITWDGRLLALNAKTGELVWESKQVKKAFSNIVEFNNQGYVISEDGRLHAFDLMTGEEVGVLDSGTPILLGPGGYRFAPSLVVADKTLAFTFGDSYVYGFEAKSQ